MGSSTWLSAVFLVVIVAMVKQSNGIGEGTLNIDKFTGILGGMANMFKSIKTVDVRSDRMLGRWYQMYKAAINFDVFRTQMFCPVAYFEENSVMGEGGFSIEEAYRVISKSGPIETYKRDVTKVAPGSYWMYTEEYFYPRQFTIIKVGPDYLLDTPLSKEESEAIDVNTVTDADSKGEPTKTDETAKILTGKPDDGLVTVPDVSNATASTPNEEEATPATDESVQQYEYMVVSDANRLSLMVYARDPVKFYAQYNKPILEYLEKAGFGGPVFWNAPRPIYQGPDCLWPTEREVFARRVLKNQRKQQGSPVSQLNPVQAVQDIQNLFTSQVQKVPYLPNPIRGLGK